MQHRMGAARHPSPMQHPSPAACATFLSSSGRCAHSSATLLVEELDPGLLMVPLACRWAMEDCGRDRRPDRGYLPAKYTRESTRRLPPPVGSGSRVRGEL